jgi:cell shape-determining protein MreC
MTKRQQTEERIQRLREEVMEMEQKELERQSLLKGE